jgi:hypothetical protein
MEYDYNAPMLPDLSARAHLCRLLAATWRSDTLDSSVSIPWFQVARLARTERVATILYSIVRKADLTVPGTVHEDLRQAYAEAMLTNHLCFQDLGRILFAVSKAGIPILLLKGAALAEALYTDRALRPMGDLDVLVRPRHAYVCRDTLVGLGYVPTELELPIGFHLALRSEWDFNHSEPSHTPVDLHWHPIGVLYYLLKLPADWFWKNSHTCEIAGSPVQVLNPEANILYLSAHLALQHRFNGLHRFLDLALLIHREHEAVNWNTVIEAAQRFELLLALQETLDRLAQYWPSLPICEQRRQLHSLRSTPFERRLFRLFTSRRRNALLDLYTDIICLPDISTRIRFTLLLAFPQRAYMVQRYGIKRAYQMPFWYLYRLASELKKWLAHAFWGD